MADEPTAGVDAAFAESIAVAEAVRSQLAGEIAEAAAAVERSLADGGKLLLFGNGGSAAEAQHVAAEFVGRFKRERDAYAAIALTTDSSILTALGNDYGFETVFARQVEALGREGDVALAMTTSGKSPNVVRGLEAAAERGLATISLTGQSGGPAADAAQIALRVPSSDTARIQEAHLIILHVMCDLVEAALASR